MKKREKMNKYQDLARELKKLWNMKVMVIPIAVGVLGTVPVWFWFLCLMAYKPFRGI